MSKWKQPNDVKKVKKKHGDKQQSQNNYKENCRLRNKKPMKKTGKIQGTPHG